VKPLDNRTWRPGSRSTQAGLTGRRFLRPGELPGLPPSPRRFSLAHFVGSIILRIKWGIRTKTKVCMRLRCGKKKVRQKIEDRVLSRYRMKKDRPDGWEYELSIPYETDKDLDEATLANWPQ